MRFNVLQFSRMNVYETADGRGEWRGRGGVRIGGGEVYECGSQILKGHIMEKRGEGKWRFFQEDYGESAC